MIKGRNQNTMDSYFILKTLHILSAAVLFGTGLGTAFHMWMTHKSGDVRAIARAARNTVLADWLFTTPAVVAQPLTGVLLIQTVGYDPMADWLVASYILYAVAGLCWLPVVWLQIRVAAVARSAVENNTSLPPQYGRYMAAWFWLGWPAFGAVIAIVWLMVSRHI